MLKFFEEPQIEIWATGLIVTIAVSTLLIVFFRLIIWRLRIFAEKTKNKIAEGSLSLILKTKIFFHIAVGITWPLLRLRRCPI